MAHLQVIKEFSIVSISLIFIGLTFMFFVCCTQYEIEESPRPELEEIQGESFVIGNGQARSFVKVDKNQNLVSLGVGISETALDKLQVTEQHSFSFLIDMPEIGGSSPVDHIALDWMYNEQYSEQAKPTHLGVQFYTIMLAERLSIVANEEERPEVYSEFIPKNFVPFTETKEGSGTYWMEESILKTDETDYNHSVIFRSHNGELTFVEPAISIDFLRSKKSIHSSVSSSVEFGKTEFSYEKYVVYFDEQTREYVVSILF